MIPFNIMIIMPIVGIVYFIFFGHYRSAGFINILVSLMTLIAAIFLSIQIEYSNSLLCWHNQIYIDAFSDIMILVTVFVSFSVAIFSNQYMSHNLDEGRINARMLQLYLLMYQLFALTMLFVYASNNIGLLWVAMEGATLSTVLLVSLYRTPSSIEAAWKYFILCIVGIALALFGTICVYFSAKNVPVSANAAMLWTVLRQHVSLLDSHVLIIAFVFLLTGYGTKVGLIPLHFWLPDAHSESPAPISALLSGLLLNVGVYALVRFKILIDLATHSPVAGHLMMALGLLSFFIAGFFIYRQSNIKRMFSYSSIEHLGLIVFSFGLSSAFAVFTAIYYLIMHSLIKSSIFMSVGHTIQFSKSQDMTKIRGLMTAKPAIGWTLLIGTLAIAGFPPFGIFNSELMLVLATIKQQLIYAIPIVIGMIVALAALLKNLHPVIFGQPNESGVTSLKINLFPVFLNLFFALTLSFYFPQIFLTFLDHAVSIINGTAL